MSPTVLWETLSQSELIFIVSFHLEMSVRLGSAETRCSHNKPTPYLMAEISPAMSLSDKESPRKKDKIFPRRRQNYIFCLNCLVKVIEIGQITHPFDFNCCLFEGFSWTFVAIVFLLNTVGDTTDYSSQFRLIVVAVALINIFWLPLIRSCTDINNCSKDQYNRESRTEGFRIVF